MSDFCETFRTSFNIYLINIIEPSIVHVIVPVVGHLRTDDHSNHAEAQGLPLENLGLGVLDWEQAPVAGLGGDGIPFVAMEKLWENGG